MTVFEKSVESKYYYYIYNYIYNNNTYFLPIFQKLSSVITVICHRIVSLKRAGKFGSLKIKLYLCSMRAVIQRVSHASVTIEGNVKSQVSRGFLILLGVCDEDTIEDVDWLVKKIANLRVFGDENDVMNRSILDVQGEALVVSQFTLYASYKKGNRPSWFRAGSHEHSIPLYEAFCTQLSEAIGKPVGTGEFGADMKVELLNDGPVTICMDTKNKE